MLSHLANQAEGHELLFSRIDALPAKRRTISAIAAHEIRYRVSRRSVTRNLTAALGRALAIFTVLPFDNAAAIAAVRVRVELERSGRQIGLGDSLQAGHALSLGATMVTDNIEHFRRVAGLRVENWRRVAR